MSDSHEPSYYEIALTNRQVVIAFVILLICLVLAFFSGLWIGREASRRGISQAASAESLAEVEAEPVEEFKFFTEAADEPPALPTLAQEARPGTTRLEDPGGGSAEPPTGTTASPPPKPVPAAKPASTAAQEPGSGVEPLFIQVFSSSDEEQARRVLERLQRGKFQAFLSPVEVPAGTMHRVRVGPFADRAKAEQAAERLRRDYKLDTWITH